MSFDKCINLCNQLFSQHMEQKVPQDHLPLPASNLFLLSLTIDCLFLIQTKGIIQYIVVYVWLLLLSIVLHVSVVQSFLLWSNIPLSVFGVILYQVCKDVQDWNLPLRNVFGDIGKPFQSIGFSEAFPFHLSIFKNTLTQP